MAQQNRKMGADGQPEEESFFAKYVIFLLSKRNGQSSLVSPCCIFWVQQMGSKVKGLLNNDSQKCCI